MSFTITVWQTAAVVVETLRLPPVMVGGSYEVPLRASGGDAGNYAWEVTAGALPQGLTLSEGTIEGTPTAGGAAVVELRVSSGDRNATASFTLDVGANNPDRFDITPYALVEIPAEIQPHVDEAIARWEGALTGNLQPATLPATFFGESSCGGFGTAVNGTTTDDIIMMINIRPIDGRGGILGQAGPCAIRNADALPIVGILTLDSDDLAPMIGTTTLTALIFHEMGHVLGFGTLWSGLRVGTATDSSSFTGVNAVEAWRALGGQGNVPLETTGGSGTRDSHWSEAVFDREVMTGFSEAIGVFQPLSRVTIASMADLGYTVDMDVADSFALYAALMADDPAAADLGHDVALTWPIQVLHEDGSSRTIDLSAEPTEPGGR
jgi:hypothetical protein